VLDDLQMELNDITTGWQTSIRSLRLKVKDEVFVEKPQSEPVAPGGEQEEEPQVSILPIDPSPGSDSSKEKEQPEKVTAEDVVIGKDKVQVEKLAKLAVPQQHEEL
jgi:hypothetical protein